MAIFAKAGGHNAYVNASDGKCCVWRWRRWSLRRLDLFFIFSLLCEAGHDVDSIERN
jgi:hypothetical protein